MALAVDSGGKVRANPNTGRVFSGDKTKPSGNGAESLRRRLEDSLPVRINPSSPPSGNILEQGSSQHAVQPQQVQPRISSSSTPRSVDAIPASSVIQGGSERWQPGQQSSLEPSYQLSSTQPPGLAASPGFNVSTEPIGGEDVLEAAGIMDRSHKSGLDVWEQMMAEKQERPVRTANLWDEEYREDGPGWLNDNQLDLVGNTPVNDTYIRDAIDRGLLSMDDAHEIMYGDHSLEPAVLNMDEVKLDETGPKTYASMTADSMSGSEYKYYRDVLGMGGREGYIHPDQVYSKRREAVNYGFKPFTPDMPAYMNMVEQNILDIPARLGSLVSNAREELMPDYRITFGEGEGKKTISGKDFDSMAGAFTNQYQKDFKTNSEKFIEKPEGDAYTALVNQFMVPSVDGGETYHYGSLIDVMPLSDGTFQFSFSDGTSVKTTPEYFESVYDETTGNVDIGLDDRIPVQSAKSVVDMDALESNRYGAYQPEYVVPGLGGGETLHHGAPVAISDAANGMVNIEFSDGTNADTYPEYWDTIYNGQRFLPDRMVPIEGSGEKPTSYNEADVTYIPDMVLPDGTRMSARDVERLYYDQTPEDDENMYGLSDDDVSYEFDSLGPISSRPRRLGGQEVFKDDGGVDISNLGNNVIDWTLGSIPISVSGIIPWLYSISNATRAVNGIEPSTYNPKTDTYGLAAGEHDENGNMRYGVFDDEGNKDKAKTDEARFWSAAGNAAVPLTEQIVGPIGGSIVPLEKIAEKAPLKSAIGKFLLNEGVGALGEGVEEVLGNIFDEMTQYGSEMYADPEIDEETGEARRDDAGREKRDRSTPIPKRVQNFFGSTTDNANSFLGGALVDMAMQSLMPFKDANGRWHVSPTAHGLSDAIVRDRARVSSGVPLYVDPDELGPDDVAEEYASLFDNELVDGVKNGRR